jgi:DNA-binding NtrC family response regulator
MTQINQGRILVTDDEVALREDLREYLSNIGYTVDIVADAASTLSSVAATEYNVLLLDHLLPDTSGLDILPDLLAAKPTLSVVMMTGYPTVDMIISAVRRGACDVVVKPFELKELSQAIARAVSRNQRFADQVGIAISDNLAGSDLDLLSRSSVTSQSDM